MGSAGSSLLHDAGQAGQQQQPPQPFSQLIEVDPVDWEACIRSLEDCPEQALLYAHGGVEPSFLWRSIQRGAPENVIQRLLECDPDAIDQVSNRGGSTIIHLAAAIPMTSPEVMKVLLQFRPHLAHVTDQLGRLPLHRCFESGSPVVTTPTPPPRAAAVDEADDDEAEAAAENPPTTSTTIDPCAACAKVLLNAYPDGLLRRCQRSGALPLHYALDPKREVISADLLRVLVNSSLALSPSSSSSSSSTTTSTEAKTMTTTDANRSLAKKILSTRDKLGRTPLQLLLERLRRGMVDSIWEVLQEWIQHYLSRPSSPHLHVCIEIGGCQTLPMMQRALMDYGYLSSSSTSSSTSKHINSNSNDDGRGDGEEKEEGKVSGGRVRSDSLHQCWDTLGRSPLHIAALNGQCDVDALRCLMDANPKAPRMTDHEGRLPIDIAAESPNTQPHCLALLIRGEPRAVNTRDLRNGCYPFLTSALSHHSSLNNTYYLLRSRPEVLSYYHTP